MPRPTKAAASPKPKKVSALEKKNVRKKDPRAPKRHCADWAKVADKSKWEKLAAKEKKRYEKDMAAYKGVAPEAPTKKVVRAKPKVTAA
ncbi:hypothetical protein ANCDUO_08607 [Ancylostoma duodenale]|uniref:HMG box n=1 Tax=Ancylostoma duodenale TaxID=51022 RepID=A0A0C2CW33_9BILA|nr:hypothetical protein ANCDUO_08607 [Ancylostoma duodenale]